jgi:hypothetical protein
MKELDWSGARVHDMAKEAGQLADLHSLAYTLASAYVHPGAVFYFSHLSFSGQGENLIKISEKDQDVESRYAIRIAHDLFLNAVDLRLKYAPSSALQDLFSESTSDFLRVWGYPPHI